MIMTSRAPKLETEVKIPVQSAAEARRLLRRAGFSQTGRRTLEVNVIFDTPGRMLKKRDALLRVRRLGRKFTLTYKAPRKQGRNKTRLEAEVEVSDTSTLEWILRQLGFVAVFRYEKYRTPFARTRGEGHIFLDETPIGCFLEVEGPVKWIDPTVRRLGVQKASCVTETYVELYEQYCKKRGLSPNAMTFGR